MRRPKIVGILNVTPDSYSDGGRYLKVENAIEHFIRLVDDGADIIDIGGESTRPSVNPKTIYEQVEKTKPVDFALEWDRIKDVLPEVRKIADERGVKISLDTKNPETLKRAARIGIDYFNAVDFFRNKEFFDISKENVFKIILMHSLDIPANPQNLIDKDRDPVEFIINRFKEKLIDFNSNQIDINRVIIDPGVCFGNNPYQAFTILSRLKEFHCFKIPLFIGFSRKTLLNIVTNLPFHERDLESHVIASQIISRFNIDFLRVHDVSGTKRMFDSAMKFMEFYDGVHASLAKTTW